VENEGSHFLKKKYDLSIPELNLLTQASVWLEASIDTEEVIGF
jgi:hypothetical protein